MTEFANAAFPWIAMGLAVAISLAYFNSKEKNSSKGNYESGKRNVKVNRRFKKIKKNQHSQDNYYSYRKHT